MAPRHMLRRCRRVARGAGLTALAWLAIAMGLMPGPASACHAPAWIDRAMPGSVAEAPDAGDGTLGPFAAWFEDPTTRYAHGVLGDAVEAGTLAVQLTATCHVARVRLPETEVFEDLAPRLVDLTGDGHPEIIVVQSDARLGARLAVFGLTPDGEDIALVAATPHIGRANRWLAPVGAGDFDGDGRMEIAYVDRPHLARTLRVWRFVPTGLGGGDLVEIASLAGLTNHRIGEDFITGGVRECGGRPEMVTADRDWRHVMLSTLEGGRIVSRAVAPFSPAAVRAVLDCQG